jgi:hypothetical protein
MVTDMLNDSKKTKILLIVAVIVLAVLGTTVKGLGKQSTDKPSKREAVVYQMEEMEHPPSPLLG